MNAAIETGRTSGIVPQEIHHSWEAMDELLPPELTEEDPDSAYRISAAYVFCPYCSRLGRTVDDIPHDHECPLAAVDDF